MVAYEISELKQRAHCSMIYAIAIDGEDATAYCGLRASVLVDLCRRVEQAETRVEAAIDILGPLAGAILPGPDDVLAVHDALRVLKEGP